MASAAGGLAQQPRDAAGDERHGPPSATATTGSPLAWASRPVLQDHLTEGVGPAGEQEHVRAGVRGRELVALQPTEERRVRAEALAQRVLLRASAGQAQMQARVALAGGEERVREQVGALLGPLLGSVPQPAK